jgi:hypothetical protein
MLEHRLLERARFQQLRTDQTIVSRLMRPVLAKRRRLTLSSADGMSQRAPRECTPDDGHRDIRDFHVFF